MTRAELHGALDRIAGEFLDSLRDGHSLSYWRQELPPQAFAVLARRSREFAAELDQLAKAQESARSIVDGAR